MARFQYGKKKHTYQRSILSACVFLLIAAAFYFGFQSLSSGTKKRQRESLDNALTRGVTYCYTVEGAYPESLEYLKENYGLIYDEDLFFVDYKVEGSNILPDITIIEKGR